MLAVYQPYHEINRLTGIRQKCNIDASLAEWAGAVSLARTIKAFNRQRERNSSLPSCASWYMGWTPWGICLPVVVFLSLSLSTWIIESVACQTKMHLLASLYFNPKWRILRIAFLASEATFNFLPPGLSCNSTAPTHALVSPLLPKPLLSFSRNSYGVQVLIGSVVPTDIVFVQCSPHEPSQS